MGGEKEKKKERRVWKGGDKEGQKGKGNKGRTSIGGNPVSFFKEVNLTYYPLSFASFLNLDFASISSTSVFPSSPCLLLLSLSLSLSPYIEDRTAPLGIRFHVYAGDRSDWPGLKPSQITP